MAFFREAGPADPASDGNGPGPSAVDGGGPPAAPPGWRGLVVVAMLTGYLAACDVVFNAPKLTLLVQDAAIAFADPDYHERLVGGETVLTIRNEGARERQIVLARLENLETVPRAVLEADTPEDDGRIIDISQVLAPVQPNAEGEAAPSESARFHVYLEPGVRHVLFDRLGSGSDRLVLKFVPGANSSQTSETNEQATAAWR